MGPISLWDVTHSPPWCRKILEASRLFRYPYLSRSLKVREIINRKRNIEQTEARSGPCLILDDLVTLSFLFNASKDFSSLPLSIPSKFEDKIRKRDIIALKMKESKWNKEIESKKNFTYVWDVQNSLIGPISHVWKSPIVRRKPTPFFSVQPIVKRL